MIKQIKDDLQLAMKNKDDFKKSVLRRLLAELENEKVKLKLGTVEDLKEAQVVTVVGRVAKALNKEIEEYAKVGRTTEKQEAEKVILSEYLPKQLSDEEVLEYVVRVGQVIKESGGTIGRAMQEISRQLSGKTDMKKVSELMKNQFKG